MVISRCIDVPRPFNERTFSFPCILENEQGTIVFFTGQHSGTVIGTSPNSAYKLEYKFF